ncbi:MAG: hypothetical protein HRU31_09570 [Rhodobacteraceae bacterium]|nr:hypothetical protein [Paracoccaceae bacterium]
MPRLDQSRVPSTKVLALVKPLPAMPAQTQWGQSIPTKDPPWTGWLARANLTMTDLLPAQP